ncbi:MAG: class I SAM-dependent RNA methyltransferase [Verrucomicrobiales bacterium]|nr:class I SAM-dependent RNA methyltransferase [Verrucomicrobiales bacterium]
MRCGPRLSASQGGLSRAAPPASTGNCLAIPFSRTTSTFSPARSNRPRPSAAGTRHLLDAYCGIGFFALELAPAVESFLGVELDTAAIHAARRNAATRHITNGEFVVGRTEEQLADLLRRGDPTRTTVLLDPPRTGCARPAIEALHAAAPAQILYVSCHPATLARDLKALCTDQRFALELVQPLDMFPQTQHVECVADLRRRPA